MEKFWDFWWRFFTLDWFYFDGIGLYFDPPRSYAGEQKISNPELPPANKVAWLADWIIFFSLLVFALSLSSFAVFITVGGIDWIEKSFDDEIAELAFGSIAIVALWLSVFCWSAISLATAVKALSGGYDDVPHAWDLKFWNHPGSNVEFKLFWRASLAVALFVFATAYTAGMIVLYLAWLRHS